MVNAMKRLCWIALIGTLLAPAVARAQSEEVVYYHTDAIGSVRMVTDASGVSLGRYDYTPFGQQWEGDLRQPTRHATGLRALTRPRKPQAKLGAAFGTVTGGDEAVVRHDHFLNDR